MYSKPIKIEKIKDFTLVIRFENNELKTLNIKALDFSSYSKSIIDKLFEKNVFEKVKIGALGQIYWENVATMQDYDGKTIPCEFDISPEYVYLTSN